MSMKFPKKVELDRYFGQIMEGLVGRPQRYILVVLGHQDTLITWGVILYHIHQFNNEFFFDVMVLMFRLDNYFGGVLISHEESIFTLR